MNTKITDRS